MEVSNIPKGRSTTALFLSATRTHGQADLYEAFRLEGFLFFQMLRTVPNAQ